MAFDLYFAGTQGIEADDEMQKRGSCRLFSQLNDRQGIKRWITYCKEHEHRKIFVDSGAYTSWSKGTQLDVDEYIKYLNENSQYLTLFACIDDIPGELTRKPTYEEKLHSPEATWENYLYMRERIIDKDKLIPVFHLGEDYSHLQRMLETKLDGKYIPYIGLGGTVGSPTLVKDNWYSQVFKIIKDSSNPNVKVHAFGMTSLTILEKYPFTSADSTSWIMTGSTGNIYTKYGTICVSEQTAGKPGHISTLPLQIQQEIEKQVNKYGTTLEECATNWRIRSVVNVNFLQDWADNYQFKGNNRFQKRLF